MSSFRQSAFVLRYSLADEIQNTIQSLVDTVTSLKWAAAELYDDVAPLVAVKLHETAIKVQTSVFFDKAIPLNVRMRKAAPYVAGAAAVLVLTVAPVSAMYQQSADENEASNHTAFTSNTADTAIVAPLMASHYPAAENAAIAVPFGYLAEMSDSELLHVRSAELMQGEDIGLEPDVPVAVIVDLSEMHSPDPELIGFDNLESNASELELSAIIKGDDEPPIVRTADIASRGTIIRLSNNQVVSQVYPTTSANSSYESTASTGTFMWPTEGRLSSLFGPRVTNVGSSNHRGIDINSRHGSPIFAADGGEVIASGWANAFGLMIKIRHDNGMVTLYAHCSELLVDVGDRVSQGQVIARMGRTGVASGVHLHFEVIVDGVQVDPLLHLPRVTRQ